MNQIEILTVSRRSKLREALVRMDQGAKGLLLLVDADGRFERTVTDGDLRRLLLKGATLEDSLDIMAPMTSHTITEGATRREVLAMPREGEALRAELSQDPLGVDRYLRHGGWRLGASDSDVQCQRLGEAICCRPRAGQLGPG